jgi:MFS family permease
MSVFKKTFPLTFTVFVNKCGTIGLNLIPMLLVEKQLTASESSIVMTIIKTTSVVGTFLGSYLCDVFSMKLALLLSFFLSGIGLGILPLISSISALTIFASFAQLGSSMFGGPMRLLIANEVDPDEQQESWGWFRLANNLGQIVSYSVGTFFSSFGINALMYFDCLTSLGATAVGAKVIEDKKETKSTVESKESFFGDSYKIFITFALVTGIFSLMYDMFIVAIAANTKLYFGFEGVKIFSIAMMINTIVCALVAVPASKKIKDPKLAIPLGILFMTLGSIISFHAKYNLTLLYFGIFVVSVGEIFYTALATFILIRITPETKKKGTIFGVALIFQPIGRIIGSALAFPYIVYGNHYVLTTSLIGAICMLIALSVLSPIKQALRT